MKMMRCDRCQQEVSTKQTADQSDLDLPPYYVVRVDKPPNPANVVDWLFVRGDEIELCPDCHNALREWLGKS